MKLFYWDTIYTISDTEEPGCVIVMAETEEDAIIAARTEYIADFIDDGLEDGGQVKLMGDALRTELNEAQPQVFVEPVAFLMVGITKR